MSEPVSKEGLVGDDATNVKQVICKRCSSKIIPPKIATYIETEFKLAPMMKKSEKKKEEKDDSGESLTQFYCLKDMFDFDNVGFTHQVDGVKYLCCADCEVGPIGYHRDGQSFVALARVTYQE